MNYMEQVAKMLGVEIGEEFRVVNDSCLYKLDDKGLYFQATDDKWKIDYFTLTSILNGKAMIIKKPILDDVEKEYLSNVVKPFRDKVTGVIKWGKEIGKGLEYIVVIYTDDCKERGMGFPCFKEGTMYKGMEPNKEYTLEDLGL